MPQIVYLVQTPTKFKIGFTGQTPQDRFAAYKTHNPDAVWVTHVEAHSQKVETALRNELRRNFKPIDGTLDWFYGFMPPEVFLSLVAQCDPQEVPPVEYESTGDMLLTHLLGVFTDHGVPIEGVIFDHEDGGLEWLEWLDLEVMYREPYTHIQITSFPGKLTLAMFSPPGISLQELVEDMCGHELDPTYCWRWENWPARILLEQKVSVLGVPPEIK